MQKGARPRYRCTLYAEKKPYVAQPWFGHPCLIPLLEDMKGLQGLPKQEMHEGPALLVPIAAGFLLQFLFSAAFKYSVVLKCCNYWLRIWGLQLKRSIDAIHATNKRSLGRSTLQPVSPHLDSWTDAIRNEVAPRWHSPPVQMVTVSNQQLESESGLEP